MGLHGKMAFREELRNLVKCHENGNNSRNPDPFRYWVRVDEDLDGVGFHSWTCNQDFKSGYPSKYVISDTKIHIRVISHIFGRLQFQEN